MQYYVSATGMDHNDGLSPATAWASIGRVNSAMLSPNDQVLFEGGVTFLGQLVIGEYVGGNALHPVLVSSYGDGKATIHGGKGNSVVIKGTGVTVSNIDVTGDGRKTNEYCTGILVYKARDIIVDGVEASGFMLAGVNVIGSTHVRITNVYAHDNGYAGICAGYGFRNESDIMSRDIYVGYCRAINNPGHPQTHSRDQSGSGINFFHVDVGVIEFCEASDNGWDMVHHANNGPVGIWLAFSKHITIQYCISHNNKTTKGDGGGFDFDSGCFDCILQYNYSYDNMGCGFLLCSYAPEGEHGSANNILRYNVSENDGKVLPFSTEPNHESGLFIWNGRNQQNYQIHNNIIYNSEGRACVKGDFAPDTFYFHNNIFLLSGDGSFVQGVSDNQRIGDGVFQGNDYWNYDGGGRWEDQTIFENWRDECGKEILEAKLVGLNIDPLLQHAGFGERLTDPLKLRKLFAYTLTAASPMHGRGLDLYRLFGWKFASVDFYGSPLPTDGPYALGIDER